MINPINRVITNLNLIKMVRSLLQIVQYSLITPNKILFLILPQLKIVLINGTDLKRAIKQNLIQTKILHHKIPLIKIQLRIIRKQTSHKATLLNPHRQITIRQRSQINQMSHKVIL